jgi:hypothetical protein
MAPYFGPTAALDPYRTYSCQLPRSPSVFNYLYYLSYFLWGTLYSFLIGVNRWVLDPPVRQLFLACSSSASLSTLSSDL